MFGSFSEGTAGVKVNGKWGLVNKKGQFVIKPKFDVLFRIFQKGLARVAVNGQVGLC